MFIYFLLFISNFNFIYTVSSINILNENQLSNKLNVKKIDAVKFRIFKTFFRKTECKIEKDLWELMKKLDNILNILINLKDTDKIKYKDTRNTLRKSNLEKNFKQKLLSENRKEELNRNFIKKEEYSEDIDDLKRYYIDKTSKRSIFILKLWKDNKLIELDYERITCDLINGYKDYLEDSIKDKINQINNFIIPSLVKMDNKSIFNNNKERIEKYKNIIILQQEKLNISSKININEIKKYVDNKIIIRKNKYPNEELRYEEYSETIISSINYFINKMN